MTLQEIAEVSSSGLLVQNPIDPFNRKEMLLLRYILRRASREKRSKYSSRELYVDLVQMICMAVANRPKFPDVSESAHNVLHYLRSLDYPFDAKNRADQLFDSAQGVIGLWETVFGDPVEFERNYMAKKAKERAEAALQIKTPEQLRAEYVRRNMFR